MTHEEICTYEVCKLAKEKGFPQWFNYTRFKYKWDYYNHKGELNGDLGDILKLRSKHKPVPEEMKPIAAPTQSLLQRWLREEKGVIIELKYSDFTEDWRPFWSWCIYNNLGFTLEIGDNPATYELALEDALKYALKHLVL